MPASWVQDEDKWEKAKKAAEKSGYKDKYAVVTDIYKKMGGRIKGEGMIEDDKWLDPTRK